MELVEPVCLDTAAWYLAIRSLMEVSDSRGKSRFRLLSLFSVLNVEDDN